MPSVSKAQHNLMAMVANDPKAAKRLKIPQSVGKEFLQADKGKTFRKGGEIMEKAKEMRHARTLEKLAKEERSEAEGMACGGKVKKMAKGGKVRGCGCAVKGKTKGRMV